MAGVKGRSGGARPGAGRPKGSKNKPKVVQNTTEHAKNGHEHAQNTPLMASEEQKADQLPVDPLQGVAKTEDPLKFLLMAMNDERIDIRTRVRAAVAAAQYTNTKKHDGGKRDEAAEKAAKAATGRFAPPKLVASNAG